VASTARFLGLDQLWHFHNLEYYFLVDKTGDNLMTQTGIQISIWFMAGIILFVYGVAVTICGVYYLFNPIDAVAADLHLDLLWGALMVSTGALFLWHQFPKRSKNADH
jgi:hypothetical protein